MICTTFPRVCLLWRSAQVQCTSCMCIFPSVMWVCNWELLCFRDIFSHLSHSCLESMVNEYPSGTVLYGSWFSFNRSRIINILLSRCFSFYSLFLLWLCHAVLDSWTAIYLLPFSTWDEESISAYSHLHSFVAFLWWHYCVVAPEISLRDLVWFGMLMAMSLLLEEASVQFGVAPREMKHPLIIKHHHWEYSL